MDSKLQKHSNSATSIPLHYRDEENSDLLRITLQRTVGDFLFSSIHINFKMTCKSSLFSLSQQTVHIVHTYIYICQSRARCNAKKRRRHNQGNFDFILAHESVLIFHSWQSHSLNNSCTQRGICPTFSHQMSCLPNARWRSQS